MLKLNYIKLNDIVVYRQAYFEFLPGISIINGNNGSGKSLIFSLLSNIFYDSHPLTGKKDTSISNGIVELSFNINIDNYILTYDYNKALKIKLFKNNEDLQFETLTAARDYLNTLKIKEDLFFISVYLTSYRTHPLLFGNFTSRFEFFNSLFDLSKLDELSEKVKKKIRSLEDLKIKKETLEQELIQTDKQIQLLNEDQLNEKKIQIDKQFKDIKETNLKSSKLLDILNTLENQLNTINKLEKTIKETESPNNSLTLLKELKYNNIIEDTAKLNNQYFVDILTRSQNLINRLEELLRKVEILENLELKIKEAANDLTNNEKSLNEENISTERQKVITEIEVLKEVLKNRKSLITNKIECKCDKCGSIISTEKLNEDIQTLERNLKVKQEEFSIINNKYNEFIDKTKKIDLLKNTIETTTNEIKNNNSQIEALTTKLSKSSFNVLQNLTNTITEVFIKTIINKLTNLNDYVNEDIKIINQRQDIIKLEALKDNYKDLINNIKPDIDLQIQDLFDITKVKERQTTLQNEISQKLNTEYRLDKELQDIMLNIGILSHNKQKKLELQECLQKIDTDLKNIEYYKVLEEVLGPKGFKEYKMKYNIKKFEFLLNKYSAFLFDDIKFELQLDKKTLAITAIRNKISSDVNKLSGSESRRFCLLVLIATLSLVDSKNKCDTLLLDEMDNGLDNNFKDKFYNSFLPELQKIIPKIIIITPDTDIPVNYNTYRYLIKKEKDTSRIIKI